jgi:magnesium chelatase family protein
VALKPSGPDDKQATHPCVCGFLTDPQKECTCTPLQIQRYRSKVSGPLLDRIDIQVEVPGLRYQELASKDAGESSNTIRERVNQARKIQLQRFEKTKIHANAQMGTREIKRHCFVKEDAEKLLETAINKLGLSARAYSLQPGFESWPNDRRSSWSRKY